jgi:hypothetical protein
VQLCSHCALATTEAKFHLILMVKKDANACRYLSHRLNILLKQNCLKFVGLRHLSSQSFCMMAVALVSGEMILLSVVLKLFVVLVNLIC